MKNTRRGFLIAAGLALVSFAQTPAVSYKDLKYPPQNQIQVPEPLRFQMANGMVVYLVEDHELPTFHAAAQIRAGSRWEPAAKAGLASLTGTVMRTGGTATRKGDDLDQELDNLGARVETGIGQDSGSGSISALKEHADKALAILADLLQNPAFPQEKIDLAKVSMRDSIARRNDNPNGIAFREFNRILFGKDSPYARQTEYATVDAITREDLLAFHKQFFQPENVILGVWGDFNSADMRARIEKVFGSWARGGKPKPAVPEVDPAARQRSGFYAINKDDMKQSWVMMGMLGGKRNDPDIYALEVMDSVLGGGFASRLFSQVRSAQGLAYSVWSNWGAGWDRPGTFTAAGSSSPEKTLTIMKSIQHEIDGMTAVEVSDDELQRAKDGILKGFAFEFDDTGKIVHRLMTYEFYGYPKNYLQTYQTNIAKVTKADVLRVAKQYLKTGQMAVLLVGNQKGFEQPLASLGQVSQIDITIPKPKEASLGPVTADGAQKGKALLAAARQAMGGAAISKVTDYTAVGQMTMETPQGAMNIKLENTTAFAGRSLSKMQTPMGEIVTGYDGAALWMKSPQGVQDGPPFMTAEIKKGFFRDTIALLQNFEKTGLKVQAIEPVQLDGKSLDGVAVADPSQDIQVKLYFDPASKLIAKKVYTSGGMGGAPSEVEEIYSDFREVSGLKLPYKALLMRGGKKAGEQVFSEFRINPGLPETAFKKPQ